MAKRIVKHKPIPLQWIPKLLALKHPLINVFLHTGVRMAEMHRIIEQWKPGQHTIDIKTKKSGDSHNRIYLNLKVIEKDLLGCQYLYGGRSARSLTRAIERASEELGYKFTAHSLRSTFATHLLGKGVNLVAVQHLMNHGDISTTAMYINLDEATLRRSVEEVNYGSKRRSYDDLVQENIFLRKKLNIYEE